MLFNSEEFYPTPTELLDKITVGINWWTVGTVLEPSAGKGNIADFVRDKNENMDIDCIELDPELRSTLTGKGFRVVHDDFLTFRTFKTYDLIIMNPPFSDGASHLSRALEMQKDGGNIICILNAETIKNPFSNERKALVQKLGELDADIEYMQDAFVSAERPTGVEIAVIKVSVPVNEYESTYFEQLKKKSYRQSEEQDITDLAPDDYIEAAVRMYETEVEAGIQLIHEYQAMCPHILNNLRDSAYNTPILDLKISDGNKVTVNRYVKAVRRKYWSALFENPKFIGQMTSNLSQEYRSKVEKLTDYDFSAYNIRTIRMEMSKNLIRGIEDCIIKLFDELSFQYHYSDELAGNIHYYNGWKTNKAWIINKKVILPGMNAYSSYFHDYRPTDYYIEQKLMDIEKALNYLDGGLTEAVDLHKALYNAEETGQTKKIRLKYFDVTFYKKGTCHIEFTNLELLKKLNIFGSQQKRWLPPAYGKKNYSEMDETEKEVVESFEGKASYEQTVLKSSYFIYDPKNSIPALGDTAAD